MKTAVLNINGSRKIHLFWQKNTIKYAHTKHAKNDLVTSFYSTLKCYAISEDQKGKKCLI